MDAQPAALDHRQRHRDQPAGQSGQVPPGAGMVQRSGAGGDATRRSSTPRPRWPSGFGCEPASAASVAGVKKLVAEGVIGPDEQVVCILTGHQLKDPTATVAYHTADKSSTKCSPPAASARPPSPTAGWCQQFGGDRRGNAAAQLTEGEGPWSRGLACLPPLGSWKSPHYLSLSRWNI